MGVADGAGVRLKSALVWFAMSPAARVKHMKDAGTT